MVAFNYGETETHSKGLSDIRPFMNKYNWDGIKYPSKIDAQKTFEKNNPSIALNLLYIKKTEICPGYISKINLNCEKKIILLMIPNAEKTRNATRCNNRDGLFYLSFLLKISIFLKAYI